MLTSVVYGKEERRTRRKSGFERNAVRGVLLKFNELA
jgi:hypothetical protein